ncbi:MAG: RNA polymerase sigma factor [Oscillospiraceae bacterium]|nr:RNA polymerase sigma factor [Oscillospiraceae bacterium]
MTDSEFAERLAAMRETLFRVCYSQLSQPCDREDAVQEALLKAWGKRHTLKDGQMMQSWVVRILINECRNIQRKRKREIPDESLPERAAPPDSPDAELHDALFRLDEKLRLPTVLHYIEGFSTGEIAAILRIPQGTALWRLSKARKELYKMLSGDCGERLEEG